MNLNANNIASNSMNLNQNSLKLSLNASLKNEKYVIELSNND